jgi:hypothetical protein
VTFGGVSELAADEDDVEAFGDQERGEEKPACGTRGTADIPALRSLLAGACKLERGRAQDVGELRDMLDRGLVEREWLGACFSEIEPLLYRFPAIDVANFRRSIEELLGS